MPKYLTRQEFESMKVLRNRKCTIKQIASALYLSPATISRNLKYNSYEDYLMHMYGKNSKSQKVVESKSGECKTVGKKCCKCGKTKNLSQFDKKKNSKDGRTNMCKKCRAAYQREWARKRAAAATPKPEPAKEPTSTMSSYDPCESPEPETVKDKEWKFNVGDIGYYDCDDGCFFNSNEHKEPVRGVITGKAIDIDNRHYYVFASKRKDGWRTIEEKTLISESDFVKIVEGE